MDRASRAKNMQARAKARGRGKIVKKKDETVVEENVYLDYTCGCEVRPKMKIVHEEDSIQVPVNHFCPNCNKNGEVYQLNIGDYAEETDGICKCGCNSVIIDFKLHNFFTLLRQYEEQQEKEEGEKESDE